MASCSFRAFIGYRQQNPDIKIGAYLHAMIARYHISAGQPEQ